MTQQAKRAMVAGDLGGTNLRVALYAEDGTQHYRSIVPTPAADPSAFARAVLEAVAIAERAGFEVQHAVLAAPGWVDYRANSIVTLPNLPAWGSIAGADLEARLGLRVTFANDADLAALGEHRFGAGAGATDMVFITCSTGVGAGVIVNGRLLTPHRSALEIGHSIIDWQTGDTVEGLGSGTALARMAGMPAEAVAARAEAGNAEAQRHFRRTADAFAVGVVNMALLFAPERIVIGGGMSEAGELLLGPVRERLARERSPLLSTRPEDIVRAALGQDVGLLGAFAYWQDIVPR